MCIFVNFFYNYQEKCIYFLNLCFIVAFQKIITILNNTFIKLRIKKKIFISHKHIKEHVKEYKHYLAA